MTSRPTSTQTLAVQARDTTSTATSAFPTVLASQVPPCAQYCVTEYAKQNWAPTPCADPSDWSCLCTHYDRAGYALGEIAWACTSNRCSQADVAKYGGVYELCSDVPSAVANTHTALTVIGPTQTTTPTSTSIGLAAIFTTGTAAETTTPAASVPGSDGSIKLSTGVVAGIASGGGVMVLVLLAVLLCLWRRRQKKKRVMVEKSGGHDFSAGQTASVRHQLPGESQAPYWTSAEMDGVPRSHHHPVSPRRSVSPLAELSGRHSRLLPDMLTSRDLLHMKSLESFRSLSSVSALDEDAVSSYSNIQRAGTVRSRFMELEDTSSIRTGKSHKMNMYGDMSELPAEQVDGRRIHKGTPSPGRTPSSRSTHTSRTDSIRHPSSYSRIQQRHSHRSRNTAHSSMQSYLPPYYTSDESRAPGLPAYDEETLSSMLSPRHLEPRHPDSEAVQTPDPPRQGHIDAARRPSRLPSQTAAEGPVGSRTPLFGSWQRGKRFSWQMRESYLEPEMQEEMHDAPERRGARTPWEYSGGSGAGGVGAGRGG